jgi:hypothetical protein
MLVVVGAVFALLALLAQADRLGWEMPEEIPGPPEPELATRLQPRGDGFFYPDPRFSVRIFADGSVAYLPRRFRPGYGGFILKPLRPDVLLYNIERSVLAHTSWQAVGYAVAPDTPAGMAGPAGQVDYEFCRPDFACWRLPNAWAELILGFGANVDVNDALWRSRGVIPYRPELARVLDATLDVRVRMAAQAQNDATQVALAQLPITLARFWLHTPLPAAQRRRVLFQLWQETDDSMAGARARAEIERFIRTALPRGTLDAFTAEELRRYDRTSSERGFDRHFTPYGRGR